MNNTPIPAHAVLTQLHAAHDLIQNRRYIYADPYFDTREHDIVGEGIGPNGPALDEGLELVRHHFYNHLADLQPAYSAWRSRHLLPWISPTPARRAPQLATDSAAKLIEAVIAFNAVYELGRTVDYSAALALLAEARQISDESEAMYHQAWGTREERAEREGWYGPPEPPRSYPGVAAVGRRMRLAREAAKLNQTELAERIGERQSHLSAMEAGQRSIGSDVLRKLAPVLGVSLDWLVYGKQP